MTIPYACYSGDPPEAMHSAPGNEDTLVLILAGGCGTRLGPLTQRQPKPALHVAGKFRSIDFTLSNCMNSQLRRIAVLTQYRSRHLATHLQSAWQFLHSQLGEFIEHWPASAGDSSGNYAGTADAVRRNLKAIKAIGPRHVLILAGDHVYKMDYRPLLAAHRRRRAGVTIGTIKVPTRDAHGFGIVCCNDNHRVTHFQEKPDVPCAIPGDADHALASMGIYAFRVETLENALRTPAAERPPIFDFGRDVLPGLVANGDVYTHDFVDQSGNPGFWRDIGTLDKMWEANMAARSGHSGLNLNDTAWPILTNEPQLPSARIDCDAHGLASTVSDSLLSNGCQLAGATVSRSVLSYDVRIDSGSVIRDSVVMPHARIGKGCSLQRCIVEEGARVPDGLRVGQDLEEDRQHFCISDGGIILVSRDAIEHLPATNASAPTAVAGHA